MKIGIVPVGIAGGKIVASFPENGRGGDAEFVVIAAQSAAADREEYLQGLVSQRTARLKQMLDGGSVVFVVASAVDYSADGVASVAVSTIRGTGIFTIAIIVEAAAYGHCVGATEGTSVAAAQRFAGPAIVVRAKPDGGAVGTVASPSRDEAVAGLVHDLASALAGILGETGLVNVDLFDLRRILGNRERIALGVGHGRGVGGAIAATRMAIAGIDPDDAGRRYSGLVVAITGPLSLRLSETRTVMSALKTYLAPNGTIIFGASRDPFYDNGLRVVVLAASAETKG